jgi:hypothetical protein
MSSSYYQYNAHQHPTSAHAQSTSSSHHSGRGRRAPRVNNQPHKQVRPRQQEAVSVINFRQRFEAGRSFDLDDDLEFCPNLLTEVDMVSIHSSTSDRSSLSSGSPEQSPQQSQVTQVDFTFSLNSNSNPYIPSYQSQPTTIKLHQPSATRVRNAIPIVNPTTGISMSSMSPPPSVSPARAMQSIGRRW